MGIFQKVPKKYLVGNDWANGFKTHNELTMYPLGKYPLAPSDTSFASQDRIPPRPPMRETEGLSSTTSTALPSGHPVLEMLNQVFCHLVTSGRLTGPFEGVSSYRLELFVLVSAEDGDTMFGELLAGQGGWLNRDGQAEHWVPIEDTIDF
jgi:hypothetical protein